MFNSKKKMLRNFIFKFIVFLFFGYVCVAIEYTQPVNTNKGFIQGEIRETVGKNLKYSSFKGIPYAVPPLGSYRFREAAEITLWKGVLNTTKNPNSCSQWDSKNNLYLGSEDCLYLNVYTPEINFTNPGSRTVMVWIHGGNFVSGSIDKYGPDFFIEKDVVIVAMNYRLGAFGFLSLNSTLASGNAGLKDQLHVLRWVRNNIKNFGGDPEKVTIFGENAGAVSVELHNLCDESIGLFRGSLAMDGTPLTSWGFYTQSKALERTYYLAKKFGIQNYNKQKIYTTLLQISAEKIAKVTQKMMTELMDVPFKPTVEPKSLVQHPFLTQCPIEKYKTGNYSHTPHLLGITEKQLGPFDKPLKALPSNSRSPGIFSIKPKRNSQATKVGVRRTQRYLKYFSPTPVFYYYDSFDYKRALAKEKIDISDSVYYDVWLDDEEAEKKRRQTPEYIKCRNNKVTMWTNYAKLLRPTLDDEKEVGVVWEEHIEQGRGLDDDFTISKPFSNPLTRLRYMENTCN